MSEEKPPEGKFGYRINDGILSVSADLKTLNLPFMLGSLILLQQVIEAWFSHQAAKRAQQGPKILVPGSGQGIIH